MKNILKITTILGISVIALNSCGPKDNPPLVFFPDMYFPIAYDPMIKTASKADGHYVSKENEIPAFVNTLTLAATAGPGPRSSPWAGAGSGRASLRAG